MADLYEILDILLYFSTIKLVTLCVLLVFTLYQYNKMYTMQNIAANEPIIVKIIQSQTLRPFIVQRLFHVRKKQQSLSDEESLSVFIS